MICGLVASQTSTSLSASNKRKLQKSLAPIVQDVGAGLHGDPLNFILPAYETLWRVVLSCLMEVNLRPGASPAWREELDRFLAEPTRSNLEQLDPDSSATAVLVAFIVKEALRLYHSTKTCIADSTWRPKRTKKLSQRISKSATAFLPCGTLIPNALCPSR
ncbi:hypothetical protein ABVK25_007455 [Lepraria finkii]|uniref:Uncharacterized protein n=1 Tax=Lepraria finkii TaxID=1340010 RepID=A0ABR4B5G2_9LECA